MFLNFINIIKLSPKTPSMRDSIKYKNFFCFQIKNKMLSYKQKWDAGRSNKGRIIIWTKGSLLVKNKHIKINYNLRFNKLSLIVSFQFIPFKNKILSLFYFANGLVTYYIATEYHILFNYCFLNKNKKLRNFFHVSIWSTLSQLKKLTFISFIEISPGKQAQYCLSSGTQSKILNIDKENKLVLIQFPSKVKKFISYYSCVFIGKIALEENKKYLNLKSGYWRSFGKKPIVRGVAMNPVDHPHGGRTKAIKYQRTPWGKTTKYK